MVDHIHQWQSNIIWAAISLEWCAFGSAYKCQCGEWHFWNKKEAPWSGQLKWLSFTKAIAVLQVLSSHRHLQTPALAGCHWEFFLTYCLAPFFFFFPWHFRWFLTSEEKYTFRWLECWCLISALVKYKTAEKSTRRGNWKTTQDVFSVLLIERSGVYFLENALSFLLDFFSPRGIHAHVL